MRLKQSHDISRRLTVGRLLLQDGSAEWIVEPVSQLKCAVRRSRGGNERTTTESTLGTLGSFYHYYYGCGRIFRFLLTYLIRPRSRSLWFTPSITIKMRKLSNLRPRSTVDPEPESTKVTQKKFSLKYCIIVLCIQLNSGYLQLRTDH